MSNNKKETIMITVYVLGLLFTAIVIILAQWLYEYARRVYYVSKIPGPTFTVRKLGNLRDIAVPSDILFIYLRQWAKDYYPIFRVWGGYIPTVNVVTPDDIEIFLSSMKHIDKMRLYEMLHEWLGTGLLTSTGEKWHTRRKILTPTFHFSILQQFIPIFVENGDLITKNLREICGEEYVDIIPYVTDITLRTICETSLGTKLTSKNETYRHNVENFGLNVVHRLKSPWMYNWLGYNLAPVSFDQRRITKQLHNFSNDVINKRREYLQRKNKNNNIEEDSSENNKNFFEKKRLAMLDMLLEVEGAIIDHDGIREEVDTFVFEGHDTTAMSICFTLLLLANHKDIQDKVVEELNDIFKDPDQEITYNDLQSMQYLERVIKESLRLYPSVPFMGRTTTEDVTTASGYFLPKGTMINVHIYDLHHLPEVYPEPYKFDPDRFLPENIWGRHPYSYLPFSAGPRNCIGQKFAFLELKSILASILRKLELHPVDTPESVQIMTDIIIRPVKGIKIKFSKRKP